MTVEEKPEPAQTLDERASISVIARPHGVGPNLLYCYRRLRLEEQAVAESNDDEVTSNRTIQQSEERIARSSVSLGGNGAPVARLRMSR